MTKTTRVSRLVTTTMDETSNVDSSSMFLTSLEIHLYEGMSIPPGYKSFSSTFYCATSISQTSPMTFVTIIFPRTYLMRTIHYYPSPPPTSIIKQHDGTYISGHLQEPNSPYVGYPSSGTPYEENSQ